MLSRQNAINQAKCIIIKVGSAVLTNEDGLAHDVLQNLVEQISVLHQSGHKVCLVSSGAVAAGKKALSHTKNKIEGLAGKQGAAAIGQVRLMREYEDAFAKHGIICAQVLLTRDDLRSRERFLNAKNTFQQLFAWNTVPIVNENDTVVIRELKFGDNDSLASLLTNLIEANLSINLTSTRGVLAENPVTSKASGLENIPILACINDIETLDLDCLCGGKTSVGTGGMYSKLLSARRTAQLGVPTLILPGKEKNIIIEALKDNSIGTWVCPSSKHISRRKYWLAYQSDAQGAVHVDKGAMEALCQSGKSLLPGGILNIEGNFGIGALIHIKYNEKSLGVGLTNYTAADLRKIKGLSRIEVAATLGNAHYPEVIHRDNLLLNAAL